MRPTLPRRQFLLTLLSAACAARTFAADTASSATADLAFKGADVFDRLLATATRENWSKLPIGQLMGRVARQLEGTPYVGFTLELSPDREFCSINLTGLDCVTFFEDTLAFARMLKRGGHTPADMLREVTVTRYRNGVVGDFTSRLHYTTDWFVDNEKKKVVKTLAPDLPGATDFTQKVGIMTRKPKNYRQLAAHPDLIPAIAKIEDEINARKLKFIPLAALEKAEPLLQTGDIVGVATTAPGIDIAHTGLVYVDDAGTRHFMDASSSKQKMKVTLEPGPLHTALNWSKALTGAMFARPLEVE